MNLLKRIFRRKFRLKKMKFASLLAEHMNLVTNGTWVQRMQANKKLDHYKIKRYHIDDV